MDKLDKVKVELRHHNVTENEAPINLGIRSQEAILPEAASNYTVSLLKFATSFNAPILHIPEDDPLTFGVYGLTNLGHTNEFKIHGLFKDVKDFCLHFNLKSKYQEYYEMVDGEMVLKRYQPFTLEYDEVNSKIIIIYNQVTNTYTRSLHMDERTALFFSGNFKLEILPEPFPGNGVHRFNPNSFTPVPELGITRYEAATDDNWAFYNFDYVQLATDLPIAQTLLSTTVNNQSTVVKMSTLGTVQTNSATQDAYYVGGLVYLPNFMITSSLNSDTPLYNFKIEPYLFYKTGHYERMKLKGGGSESTYALIEFEPKE